MQSGNACRKHAYDGPPGWEGQTMMMAADSRGTSVCGQQCSFITPSSPVGCTASIRLSS